MNIKTRKIVTKELTQKDENIGKIYKTSYSYENGFVEEHDINPRDIGAFSLDKSIRIIGVNKDIYYLTLKSWKETKKELAKNGILDRLSLEKRKR